MRKYKNYINEALEILNSVKRESSKLLEVFHGDDFGLKDINNNYKLMAQPTANMQEGPGIYFSNKLKVAETYGKYIVKTYIDTSKFMESRNLISHYLSNVTIFKILAYMYNNATDDELENLFYFASDFIEIYLPKDLNLNILKKLATRLDNEEVRNFLITLIRISNTKTVVEAILKYTKYQGTKNLFNGIYFYALWHSDYPIEEV